MYAEEKNYNVSITCKYCKETDNIAVTAETVTQAEEKAKSKIFFQHTRWCRGSGPQRSNLIANAKLESQISGN